MKGIEFNISKGFTISKHVPDDIAHFDQVFDIFKELVTHTSGDLDEAFDWLNELNKEYDIFNDALQCSNPRPFGDNGTAGGLRRLKLKLTQ